MRRWVAVALLFSLLGGPGCAGAQGAPDRTAPGASPFPPDTRKVVLLVIDRLSVDDLTADPEPVAALRGLAERGGIGLMNVRTAAQANSRNGYLTVGTGVRSEAGAWAGFAFHVGERFRGHAAGDVYRSLTGTSPQFEIVHLGIGEMRRLASFADRMPVPGALGDLLRGAGKRVSVYGNGDVQGEERRYAALIGMDTLGLVDAGEIGSGLLLVDPSWPGLQRTDYDKLADRVHGAVERDDFVVVDLADLARLDELGGQVDPGWYGAARKEALRRIDAFVAELAAALDARDEATAVLVVSPSPAKAAAEQGVLLAPAIAAVLGGGRRESGPPGQSAAGQGPAAEGVAGQSPAAENPGGQAAARQDAGGRDTAARGSKAALLMSLSTKRPGLVMNTDVAPAVASALGVDGGEGRFDGGRIVIAREVSRPWEWLAREYARIAAVHSQRLSVIQPFFFAQMGILLAGALLTWALARRLVRWSPALRRAWRLLLLAAFSFPLALLLLSPLEPAPIEIVWARIAIAVAALVTLALAVAKSDLGAPGVLAGATAAALLFDMILGEPLMAGSLLGYSPISGSRFYGIGNEYMGILIGSSFVLAGAYLDRRGLPGRSPVPGGETGRPGDAQAGAAGGRAHGAQRLEGEPSEAHAAGRLDGRDAALVTVYFAVVAVFLAAPRLGVNVGGTITAVVGFGYFLLALFGRRFTLARAALLGLLVLALLVGIGVVDGRFGGGATHLGQTVQKVGQQGADPLWTIFERKVNVNLRLIRLTIWSRVVLLSLGVLALFVFWPGRLMGEMKRRYPFMTLSLRGAFVAALVTLAANDSGIVAAATLLLPATLVALLLLPEVAAGVGGGERAEAG